MGDQKYNVNKRIEAQIKRDQLVIKIASIIGAVGFIYALAVTQSLVVAL